MRSYGLMLSLFLVACPSIDEGTEASVSDGGTLLNSSFAKDAGLSLNSDGSDAGLVQATDGGAGQEAQATLDAGATEESSSSSEDVISICADDIQEPDGGFQNDIGIVQAQREGQAITVTVTLFDVNCGITEFNLLMEETERKTVLKTTVSPVNLSNETPLTRCSCDMEMSAVYVDVDNSLEKVSAYFYSDVVLDNVDAIPQNGFMGDEPL